MTEREGTFKGKVILSFDVSRETFFTVVHMRSSSRDESITTYQPLNYPSAGSLTPRLFGQLRTSFSVAV